MSYNSRDNGKVSATASSGGIGFAGLLTLVFITLKLLGVITWSWVWVLSPIWVSLLLCILIIIICFAVFYLLMK